MELEDIHLGDKLWLHGDGLDDLPVIVVSCEPLKVRFPNGHIEEVSLDEVSPRGK